MGKARTGTCYECGKKYEDIKEVCGHCGYAPHGVFMMAEQDPFWKCGGCGRIVQAQTPPAQCPGCGEVCDFRNITCYEPECGGPGNIDGKLS
jgi:DNA-directed RNA polymerase subunit RPC12/RpoP